jgi:protein subunit release factor A
VALQEQQLERTVLKQRKQEIQESEAVAQSLSEDDSESKELKEMYLEEIAQLTKDARQLEAQVMDTLLPSDPLSDRNAIIEVRAGTTKSCTLSLSTTSAAQCMCI